ncbi:hypothetical protein AAG570_007819 [Ranatra chinensis]|uniref:Ubiquitin-like domain-containing protein n=1 Tax=Ranatra chinensis TaxID=642074 RepID=A0ABD0XUP7_9HEMI
MAICQSQLETSSSEQEMTDHGVNDEWHVQDLEKVLHFLGKIFLLNFPLYIAYKQNVQNKTEELTQFELSSLKEFCDLHDLEVPIHLLRNVSLFCRKGGVQAMTTCFEHEALPIPIAHAMIAAGCNLKLWLNYHAIVQLFVPLRTNILRSNATADEDSGLVNTVQDVLVLMVLLEDQSPTKARDGQLNPKVSPALLIDAVMLNAAKGLSSVLLNEKGSRCALLVSATDEAFLGVPFQCWSVKLFNTEGCLTAVAVDRAEKVINGDAETVYWRNRANVLDRITNIACLRSKREPSQGGYEQLAIMSEEGALKGSEIRCGNNFSSKVKVVKEDSSDEEGPEKQLPNQEGPAKKLSGGKSALSDKDDTESDSEVDMKQDQIVSANLLREMMDDMLSGDDMSISSRISNKSEKNMADFDGEDSGCDEEIAHITPVTYGQDSRRIEYQKRLTNKISLVPGSQEVINIMTQFDLENVCKPGNILLWDLIQDDKIVSQYHASPDGPIRIIANGQEITPDFDEKTLQEVGFKESQLVYISVGAVRGRKKDIEYPSSLPAPPQHCLPTLMLLTPQYFEQLFTLMHTLSTIEIPSSGSGDNWVKSVLAQDHSWTQMFVQNGGLKHLFHIFMSGDLKALGGGGNEWQQDCLACLLKLLCEIAVVSSNPVLEETKVKVSPAKLEKNVPSKLSEVVQYAMMFFLAWCHTDSTVCSIMCSHSQFGTWLSRLLLEEPDPSIRCEVSVGLYRLEKPHILLPYLINFLPTAVAMRPSFNSERVREIFLTAYPERAVFADEVTQTPYCLESPEFRWLSPPGPLATTPVEETRVVMGNLGIHILGLYEQDQSLGKVGILRKYGSKTSAFSSSDLTQELSWHCCEKEME